MNVIGILNQTARPMNNEYGHSCDCEQDWNFFTVKSESGMGQPNYNVGAGNIHIFIDQSSVSTIAHSIGTSIEVCSLKRDTFRKSFTLQSLRD